MLVLRKSKSRPELVQVPSRAGSLGYVQPDSPIPVILARDEEVAAENDATVREKVVYPPPAYGLWRSSVVSIATSLTPVM
jgi:hypothetical protein